MRRFFWWLTKATRLQRDKDSGARPVNAGESAFKVLLVPDDYHLQDVGYTAQGNGFWITQHLVSEIGGTRDFVGAYIFDSEGELLSSEVVDQGLRSEPDYIAPADVVTRLRRKIDASCSEQIWVKPFSVQFYGHDFGLVVRDEDVDDQGPDDIVVDLLPGCTLMFYGPWDSCNYDT
ncbi:hypothetical protein [Yoonia sp. I 8.24]|uniref:hypothetical protein n=1 Tax=Yoonia sp. I 8.24 TaxID=1537229 RepID=UPI001EE001D2|nr:hypothetical protein [Yoonia sp. I 8.24]MCG3267461.1 hypothetical protein [Yoonia sp. I 8.24]